MFVADREHSCGCPSDPTQGSPLLFELSNHAMVAGLRMCATVLNYVRSATSSCQSMGEMGTHTVFPELIEAA